MPFLSGISNIVRPCYSKSHNPREGLARFRPQTRTTSAKRTSTMPTSADFERYETRIQWVELATRANMIGNKFEYRVATLIQNGSWAGNIIDLLGSSPTLRAQLRENIANNNLENDLMSFIMKANALFHQMTPKDIHIVIRLLYLSSWLRFNLEEEKGVMKIIDPESKVDELWEKVPIVITPGVGESISREYFLEMLKGVNREWAQLPNHVLEEMNISGYQPSEPIPWAVSLTLSK